MRLVNAFHGSSISTNNNIDFTLEEEEDEPSVKIGGVVNNGEEFKLNTKEINIDDI